MKINCSLKHRILGGTLISLLAISACSKNEFPPLDGKLIGSDDFGIYLVDFDRAAISVTAPFSDTETHRRKVATYDANSFLYEACSNVTTGCAIYRYDFQEKVASKLIDGKAPYCVIEHNRLFFYKLVDRRPLDGALWATLHMSDCDGVMPAVEIAKYEITSAISTPAHAGVVTQISPDEVVYFDNAEGQLIRFNVRAERKTLTGILDCLPHSKRHSTDQLICKDITDGTWFLRGIKSGEIERLPELKNYSGTVYIPEYDAFIYHSAGYRFPIGERYDTYVYYFRERVSKRIIEHMAMTSAIWLGRSSD